jgi:xylan 1,4-beta-xylosidase
MSPATLPATDRRMICNPVLRGFHPDPSILRVGLDYYIATSTFEWFPGVEIHHSRDLAEWRLLTRPLDRPSQLNMLGNPDSGGVWAPCLSFSDGIYYLVYTDVKSWRGDPYKTTHNYLVTAPSIEGPWSEPVYLNSSGFDPSLFHDEDGRKWYLNMLWDHRMGKNRFAGILLQEFCPKTRRLIGPAHNIFTGTERGLVEGPHLYRRNGWYYLLTAEGGTEYAHACTFARSRTIEGPYELHPEKHLLTSHGRPEAPLQKAGHGSLVETPNGEWYLAHLCGRPVDGKHCILGRETAIQACVWHDDDWLRLAQGGSVPALQTTGPHAEASPPPPGPAWDGHFRPEDGLDACFQSLRQPVTEDWLSLGERPGHLRLKGMEPTISTFRQSLIARRVESFHVRVETEVDFQPRCFQQMAGLIAYYDTSNHYYLRISRDENQVRGLNILTRDCSRPGECLETDLALPPAGPVRLALTLHAGTLHFEYALAEGPWRRIGPDLDATILSDDYDHLGFTGMFVGMCCQDLTGQKEPADFRFFQYREWPDPQPA